MSGVRRSLCLSEALRQSIDAQPERVFASHEAVVRLLVIEGLRSRSVLKNQRGPACSPCGCPAGLGYGVHSPMSAVVPLVPVEALQGRCEAAAGAQRPAEGAPLRGEVAGREALSRAVPDGNHGDNVSKGGA